VRPCKQLADFLPGFGPLAFRPGGYPRTPATTFRAHRLEPHGAAAVPSSPRPILPRPSRAAPVASRSANGLSAASKRRPTPFREDCWPGDPAAVGGWGCPAHPPPGADLGMPRRESPPSHDRARIGLKRYWLQAFHLHGA